MQEVYAFSPIFFPLNPLEIISKVIFAAITVQSCVLPRGIAPPNPVGDALRNGIMVDLAIWSPVVAAQEILYFDIISKLNCFSLEQPVAMTSGPVTAEDQTQSFEAWSLPTDQTQPEPVKPLQATSDVNNAVCRLTKTQPESSSQSEPSWARLHASQIRGGIHVDTLNLRRSTRANKYDGFKVSHPTDAKKNTSKVKPRVTPSATPAAKSGTALNAPNPLVDRPDQDIPPPTTLATMQDIGTRMCGVPLADLSPDKLLASLQEEEENSN